MKSKIIEQLKKERNVSSLSPEERDDVAHLKQFFDLYGVPMETIHKFPNLVEYAREYGLSLERTLHLSFELSYHQTPEDRIFAQKILSRERPKRVSAHTLHELCSPYLLECMDDAETLAFKEFVNGNLLGIFEAMFETPELMPGHTIARLQNDLALGPKNKKETRRIMREIDTLSDHLDLFHQTFAKLADPDLFFTILNRKYFFKRADDHGFIFKTLIEHADDRKDGAFLAAISHIAILFDRSSDLFSTIQKIPGLAPKVYHTPNESYYAIFEQLSLSQKRDFLSLSFDNGQTLFDRLVKSDPSFNPLIWLNDFICSTDKNDFSFVADLLNKTDGAGTSLKVKAILHKDNADVFFLFLSFLETQNDFVPTFHLLLSNDNATSAIRRILDADYAYPNETFAFPAFEDYVIRDADFVQRLAPSRLKDISSFLSKKVFDSHPVLFKNMLEAGASFDRLSKEDVCTLAFQTSFKDFIRHDACNPFLFKTFCSFPPDAFSGHFDKDIFFEAVSNNRHQAVRFLFDRVPFPLIAEAFMEKNPLVLTNTAAQADMFKQIKSYLLRNDPEILSALEEELVSSPLLLSACPVKKKKSDRHTVFRPAAPVSDNKPKAADTFDADFFCYPHFKNQYKKLTDLELAEVNRSIKKAQDSPRSGDYKVWDFAGCRAIDFSVNSTQWRLIYKALSDKSVHFYCVGPRRSIYAINDPKLIEKQPILRLPFLRTSKKKILSEKNIRFPPEKKQISL